MLYCSAMKILIIEDEPELVKVLRSYLESSGYEVITASDGWTVLTADGSPSAHFEHTILILDNSPEILTVC